VGQDATVNPVTGETGPLHGFLWQIGRYTKFDVPGSTTTVAYEINNRGLIVGVYLDARPKLVSFLYKRGRYTRIEAPGRCDTAAVGLNERGQILIAAAGTTDGSTCPPQGGS
jgi:uncharacterized membrane protein